MCHQPTRLDDAGLVVPHPDPDDSEGDAPCLGGGHPSDGDDLDII
ncbi:MAG: hypothetical protein Q7S80_02665 [bacterium]|nr:hypothetical protein [bacterium]